MNMEDERLDELASAALLSAMERNWYASHDSINTLNREYGGHGLVSALYLWSDTLISHLGGHGPDKMPAGGLRLQSANNGKVSNLDEVDADLAWAVRFVAARQLLDNDQNDALLTVLTSADHKRAGRLIGALLTVTSMTLACHLHTCPVGIAGTHDDQKTELPKPPPGHTWN